MIQLAEGLGVEQVQLTRAVVGGRGQLFEQVVQGRNAADARWLAQVRAIGCRLRLCV